MFVSRYWGSEGAQGRGQREYGQGPITRLIVGGNRCTLHAAESLKLYVFTGLDDASGFFPQRAWAAFCAISLRRAGDSFLFRIATNACATGFFFGVFFIQGHYSSRKYLCCPLLMLTKALT
jgi:hypothetical protein